VQGSLLHGRNDGGALHKDLMSPPVGYPLHTGDLDVDYGMGAMGVDDQNQMILFEVRSSPTRPKVLSLDAQVREQVRNEFNFAARFNTTLRTGNSLSRSSTLMGGRSSQQIDLAASRNLIKQLGYLTHMVSIIPDEISRLGDSSKPHNMIKRLVHISVSKSIEAITELEATMSNLDAKQPVVQQISSVLEELKNGIATVNEIISLHLQNDVASKDQPVKYSVALSESVAKFDSIVWEL